MIFPSGRRERKPDPMKFSKKVVAAMLISVAAFTVTMVVVFLKMGSVPDTLITAFFRSEEHTSELQTHSRISSDVICL